ncbi:MAG: hypothetical protein ABI162_17545 [Luteolibacter sp.]
MMRKSSPNWLKFIAAAGLLAVVVWRAAPVDQPEVKEKISQKAPLLHEARNGTREEHDEWTRLVRLTETDPGQAAREVSVLPESSRRTDLLLEIASELVRTDFHEALKLAETLPSSPPCAEVLERAVREWALADPAGAIAHAKSFIDEALRERLLAAAFVEWSETDPVAAASAAATELREGRIQDNAIVSISQRWTKIAPAEASAWIESFPQSDLQDDARAEIHSHSIEALK